MSLAVRAVLACVVLALSASLSAAQSTADICVIFFSLPGNVEYPWTTATKLSVTYNNATANSVTLLTGSGTRTYTNKYGQSITTAITLNGPNVDKADNLFYLNGKVVDTDGFSYNLATPTQFPGHGPLAPMTTARISTDSTGVIVEQNSFIIDNTSISITSSVPGFTAISPVGCPFVNPNCGHFDTSACTSTIDSGNGGILPPTSTTLVRANRTSYGYSYFLGDGATYSVSASLTLAINQSLGFRTTQLGDYYLTVDAITGTRTYDFPLGTVLTQSVASGVSQSAYANADQSLYPFAYVQQTNVYPSASKGAVPGLRRHRVRRLAQHLPGRRGQRHHLLGRQRVRVRRGAGRGDRGVAHAHLPQRQLTRPRRSCRSPRCTSKAGAVVRWWGPWGGVGWCGVVGW